MKKIERLFKLFVRTLIVLFLILVFIQGTYYAYQFVFTDLPTNTPFYKFLLGAGFAFFYIFAFSAFFVLIAKYIIKVLSKFLNYIWS